MLKIKQLENNRDIEGKRVLLRVDFNVPLNNSSITETSRIQKVLPTIKSLINKRAKIIIMSHLGRPKGKIVPELTLMPVAKKLSDFLNQNVVFLDKNIGKNVIEKTKEIPNGKVLLLENLRFYSEEELNDDSFSKELSKNGDIYINEAFSCSHRAHASVSKITRYIDSFAGKMLFEEVNFIKMLTSNAKKPVTCIIGGSKISTKINILTSLIKNSENLIVVGAMANNFIKFKNINVGKSLIENGVEKILKNIIDLSERNNCKIIIPLDVNSSTDLNGTPIRKDVHDIGSKEMILDIGEKTIGLINKIVDDSKTVFWNGPAGYYENENFSEGTISIARKIAKNTKTKSLVSIIGGGDTLAAIKNTGLQNSFTHLSTAGGAFLESLEGKELPGIKVLKKN